MSYQYGNETPVAAPRGVVARFGTWVADRVVAAIVAFALTFSGFPVSSAMAAGETRSLKIYFVHTGERANIVFKRNGRYDEKGLQALNRMVRDWRRNEPTRMDPRLFDLVWQVYQAVGAQDYIHVVSGYRSPTTNAMLRSRTKGVAKKSQHMLGKAMDFYIPGVPLKKLRETAMRYQVGGVGYYPTSGSPFVHLDVGGVRAWPRMSRQELVRLFPDGKTLHIPSDGAPLPGYQQALAEYKRNGGTSSVMMADASPSTRSKKRTFLTSLFGGGDEDEDGEAITAPAPAPARVPPVAKAAPEPPAAPAEMRELPGSDVVVASAPVPAQRPAFAGQIAGNGLATALYSPPRSTAQEAIAAVLPVERPQTLPAGAPDLAGMAVPVPTLLSSRNPQPDVSPVVTASISPDLAAGIPVPAARPAVAESLMAGTDADPEAEEDEAEQQALSRDMVTALTTSGADARRDFQAAMEKAASATVVASRVPVPTQPEAARQPAKATEVAALEPAAAPKGRFGDVFDTPVAAKAPAGIEAGLPEKGGRPQKAEAEKARRALTSGTAELTGDKLAQWAFSRQRQQAPTGAFKAPRVLAQTLAGAGAEDRPQQLETDQDRFKGNARVLTVNIR